MFDSLLIIFLIHQEMNKNKTQMFFNIHMYIYIYITISLHTHVQTHIELYLYLSLYICLINTWSPNKYMDGLRNTGVSKLFGEPQTFKC